MALSYHSFSISATCKGFIVTCCFFKISIIENLSCLNKSKNTIHNDDFVYWQDFQKKNGVSANKTCITDTGAGLIFRKCRNARMLRQVQ